MKTDRIIENGILTFLFFLPVFIPIGLIGFLIATIYLIFKKKKGFLKIEPKLFLFALYGLVFCAALSVIFSPDKLRSLGGFLPFLFYPLASILMFHATGLVVSGLVPNKVEGAEPKEKMLRALILAGIIVVFFAIIQRTIGVKSLNFELFGASVSINGLTISLHRLNRLARFLILSIPLGFGIFMQEKSLLWKFLSLVFVAAGTVCMFITHSLGGIGALGIVAILFIIIKNWKLGFLLILLICATVLIKPAIIENFTSNYTSHHSWSIRVQTWKDIAIPIFKDYPLTGCGLVNYTPVSRRYGGKGLLHSHAHSLYFHYLAETGILGLLSLLFIIGVSLRYCLTPINKTSPIALACGLAIIGAMIAGITETFFEFLPIGIFFWTVIGIGISHLRKN